MGLNEISDILNYRISYHVLAAVSSRAFCPCGLTNGSGLAPAIERLGGPACWGRPPQACGKNLEMTGHLLDHERGESQVQGDGPRGKNWRGGG